MSRRFCVEVEQVTDFFCVCFSFALLHNAAENELWAKFNEDSISLQLSARSGVHCLLFGLFALHFVAWIDEYWKNSNNFLFAWKQNTKIKTEIEIKQNCPIKIAKQIWIMFAPNDLNWLFDDNRIDFQFWCAEKSNSRNPVSPSCEEYYSFFSSSFFWVSVVNAKYACPFRCDLNYDWLTNAD